MSVGLLRERERAAKRKREVDEGGRSVNKEWPRLQLRSAKNAGAHANVRKCSGSCSTAEVQQAAGETRQLLPHQRNRLKQTIQNLNVIM